jgi:hypothetical protein
LKNSLINLNNLEVLDIISYDEKENTINDNGYLYLNDIIINLTNLKYLNLNYNRISDKSFENFKECLITHKSLTYLDLSNVNFFDKTIKTSNILKY